MGLTFLCRFFPSSLLCRLVNSAPFVRRQIKLLHAKFPAKAFIFSEFGFAEPFECTLLLKMRYQTCCFTDECVVVASLQTFAPNCTKLRGTG